MQQHYPAAQYAAVASTWGDVCDVYVRKTRANEYELRVCYGADVSASRLHPTLRVSRVDIVVDKPRPAMATLDDLAEARLMCAPGCGLLAFSGPGPRELVVFSLSPSSGDRLAADGAARNFGTPSQGDAKYSWRPSLRLIFDEGTRPRNAPSLDWMHQPVLEVLVAACDPTGEADLQRKIAADLRSIDSSVMPPADMGSWSPAPSSH